MSVAEDKPAGAGQDSLGREVSDQIARKWFAGAGPVALSAGPLSVNYFSIVFPLEIRVGENTSELFVKIPKTDLRRRPREEIVRLTDADRALGRDEYASLTHLATAWQADDLRVRFVKPVGYVEEYNAVVTERARGVDGFPALQKRDRARLIGADDPANMDILFRIGCALRRFHDRFRTEASFEGAALLPKLRRYCEHLAGLGVSPRMCRRTVAALDRCLDTYRSPAWRTTTLKGIDVRNVMTGGPGDVTMIDPGKMKTTFRECDLARFVMTWRILHWGSPLFALRVKGSPKAEAAFLGGYFGEERPNGTLLTVFLVKEILKHWFTAHDSLRLRGWPGPLRRLTARCYIDPFYKRALMAEVRKLHA